MTNNKIPKFQLDDKQRLYGSAIPIVGLTGGIGTGKSTISQMLVKNGLNVIDADLLVKGIYQKNESIEFIHKLIPEAIINDVINFPLLREKVFQDTKLKKIVEDFIYKRLPEAFLEKLKLYPNAKFVIYDAPLLFENKLHLNVDLTVLVYTDEKTQLERALKRDQSKKEVIQNIIKAQLPIENKKKMADFIIDNSGTLMSSKTQVNELILKLNTLKKE